MATGCGGQKKKPAGRMPGILAPRFAGLTAPPSPEVEAGPSLSLQERGVKKLVKGEFSVRFSWTLI